MFPEEFFRQIYRIRDWPYKPGNAKRNPLIGHMINNKYIYKQLPPGVSDSKDELKIILQRSSEKHQRATQD